MPGPNKLYQSVVPIGNDATRVNMRERVAPMKNQGEYVIIGGKMVLKSSLNQQDEGTINDLGGKPSMGRTLNEKSKDYWKPLGGRLETNVQQLGELGKGVAKTVGASAAMATGAAYSSPVVGTLAGLARNVVAGSVGMEGFAMLDGRTATPTEVAMGAGMEMLGPMAGKVPEAVSFISNKGKQIYKGIKKGISNYKKINDYQNEFKQLTNNDHLNIFQSSNDIKKANDNIKTLNQYSENASLNLNNALSEAKSIDNINKNITAAIPELPNNSLDQSTVYAHPYQIFEQLKNKNLLSHKKSGSIFSFKDQINYPVDYTPNLPSSFVHDYLSQPVTEGIYNIRMTPEGKVYPKPFEIPGYEYSEGAKVGDKLKEIVKSNVDFLEKEFNGKVIGTPSLIDVKGFNRLPHDYDITVPSLPSDSKYPSINPTTGYSARYGKTINLNGQEIDLNAASHPEYAKDITSYLEAKGIIKPTEMTHEEFASANLGQINPTEKTLFDKAQSIKQKHQSDFNKILIDGDGEGVLEAVRTRNKVLFPNAKAPTLFFGDKQNNVETLTRLGYDSTMIEKIADNPKKMQAIFEDYYFKKTSYGRQVNGDVESVIKYKNNTGGGEAYGLGQYSVVGDAGHYGDNYGFVHSPDSHIVEKPFASAGNVLSQLDYKTAPRTMNVDEQEQVRQLLNKHGVTGLDINNTTRTSDVIGSLHTRTQVDNTHTSVEDPKLFMKEFSDIIQQDAIILNSNYGKGKLKMIMKDPESPEVMFGKTHEIVGKGSWLSNEQLGKKYLDRVEIRNYNKTVVQDVMEKLRIKSREKKWVMHDNTVNRLNRIQYEKKRALKEISENNQTIKIQEENLKFAQKKLLNYSTHAIARVSQNTDSQKKFVDINRRQMEKYNKIKNDAKVVGIIGGLGVPIGGTAAYIATTQFSNKETPEETEIRRKRITENYKAVQLFKKNEPGEYWKLKYRQEALRKKIRESNDDEKLPFIKKKIDVINKWKVNTDKNRKTKTIDNHAT